MADIKFEEVKDNACNAEFSSGSDGDNHWCEELLARTTEGLLRRVEDDLELGLEEIEYKGLTFDVKDDIKGWTYCFEGYECRSLEEILLHLEDVLRQ